MPRPPRHKELNPPYRDSVFMESHPARPVRILTEYIDPLERMRREKIGDTVVLFGSARVQSREKAQAYLQRLRKSGKNRKTAEHREAVRSAKTAMEMSNYYEEARELSRRGKCRRHRQGRRWTMGRAGYESRRSGRSRGCAPHCALRRFRP